MIMHSQILDFSSGVKPCCGGTLVAQRYWLHDIVGLGTIEQCAFVDSTDRLGTSLTSSTVADLTFVRYGDVDLSATFLIA